MASVPRLPAPHRTASDAPPADGCDVPEAMPASAPQGFGPQSGRGGTMPMPLFVAGEVASAPQAACDEPAGDVEALPLVRRAAPARASDIGPSMTPTIPGPEAILARQSRELEDEGRDALPPPAPLRPYGATPRSPSDPGWDSALPAPVLPSLEPPMPVVPSPSLPNLGDAGTLSAPWSSTRHAGILAREREWAAAERRSTGVPVESPATQPPPKRRPMHWLAAGAAVIALGAAAWWTMFGSDVTRPSAATAQPVGSTLAIPPVVATSEPEPAVTASVSASADALASASTPPAPAPATPAPPARRQLPF